MVTEPSRLRANRAEGTDRAPVPAGLDHLVDGLAAEVRAGRPPAGRTRVVAVDGPSGTGKTTLAGALARKLDGAPVVHMDHIYPGWDGLDDSVPTLVRWVLEPLGRKDVARYRRYDWTAGEYAEWHRLPTSPFVVVEGVGSGARACSPYLSLLVWLEAPLDVRFARGMDRDGDGYRPHWDRWARQEGAHFAREGTRGRADVRISTALDGCWERLG